MREFDFFSNFVKFFLIFDIFALLVKLNFFLFWFFIGSKVKENSKKIRKAAILVEGPF